MIREESRIKEKRKPQDGLPGASRRGLGLPIPPTPAGCVAGCIGQNRVGCLAPISPPSSPISAFTFPPGLERTLPP